MGPKKDGGKKAGSSKAYARPEHVSSGEILTDLCDKKWKIGKSIGSGGFGDIYLASDDISKNVNDKANFVVKFEPFTNGPLFVEVAFYIRVAKLNMIKEWKESNQLESLGMPWYVGSGNHEYKNSRYRFLIIPRFGQDLYKILESKPRKRFALRTVQALAIQIIDILEYIHSKEFVHGDIKASNLMVGLYSNNANRSKKQFQQVYLVDYGLATKYVNPSGVHAVYGPDARNAHNGTLEYTSRDAHIGAFSRRGDLEILCYNMMEWLYGYLPWPKTGPPEKISKQKQAFMKDLDLKKVYPTDNPGIDIMDRLLKYVAKLGFEDKPNYKHCKEIIKKGLPSAKGNLYIDDVSVLSPKKTVSKRAPVSKNSDTTPRKKFCSEAEGDAKVSTRNTHKVTEFDWTRVLSSDPEKMVRASFSQQGSPSKDEKSISPTLENPTPAMLQILAKKKENLQAPISTKASFDTQGSNTLTPAMKEVMMSKRKKNMSKSEQDLRSSSSERPRRARRRN